MERKCDDADDADDADDSDGDNMATTTTKIEL